MMLVSRDYGSGLILTENQLNEGGTMRYKYFIVIFFIVTANSFASESWNEIDEIILNEKEHLITLCAPHKKFGYDRYYELRNYLTGVDTVIGSVEKLKRIVNSIQGLGADEKIYKLMIDLLMKIKSRDVSRNVNVFIYDNRRVDLNKKYSSDLKLAIKNNQNLESDFKLYSLCELNEEDKNIIRKRIEKYNLKLAIEDSVRLSDTAAEYRLISLYEQESNFREFKKNIAKLTLARTKKCELALVRSLETKNQIITSMAEDYSIKYYILEALGILNPDNTLFNSELKRIKSELWIAEKKYYGCPPDVQNKITNDYYKKVYDMVVEKYDIKLELLKNEVFLYKMKSEIIYDVLPSKSRRKRH